MTKYFLVVPTQGWMECTSYFESKDDDAAVDYAEKYLQAGAKETGLPKLAIFCADGEKPRFVGIIQIPPTTYTVYYSA